jgi:hypothetical protein
MLALTLALLIASTAWQAPGNRFGPFAGIAYSGAQPRPRSPGCARWPSRRWG